MSRYITTVRQGPAEPVDGRVQIKDMNIYFMKVLNEGMAGMTHEKDIEVAETLRDIGAARGHRRKRRSTWRRKLNEAVVEAHQQAGMDIPDLNEVDDKRFATSVNFCFPHYFLLPTYGSASSYRIRPLGPGGMPVRAVVVDTLSARRGTAPIKTPDAHGLRRPALAADSDAGFLEPAAPAAWAAHEGFRVHAPVEPGRRTDQQLSAPDRWLLDAVWATTSSRRPRTRCRAASTWASLIWVSHPSQPARADSCRSVSSGWRRRLPTARKPTSRGVSLARADNIFEYELSRQTGLVG